MVNLVVRQETVRL